MKLKKTLSIALAAATVACLFTGFSSPRAVKPASSPKYELTFYYPVVVGGDLAKKIDALCAGFNASQQNVKVDPIYTGSYADTRTKVETDLQSGNAPDVAIMFSTDLFSLLDMDAITDVGTVSKKDNQKDVKSLLTDFYPAFMLNTQVKGKTWGIPFQRSTILLYYNKDDFKAAGLNSDKAPATWKELESDAKKLTKSGRYGIEIPSTDYAYWMLQTFTLQQKKKNLMSADGTKVYFNSQEAVNGLTFWKKLMDEGAMPKGITTWATTPTDFLQNKTAMMYHTTGNLTSVKNSATFNFGVAILPADENRGTPTGGGNFYIFKKNKSADRQYAAWQFVKWMVQPQRIAQWSIDTGYVAPRKTAYQTSIMKNYVKGFPYAQVARDQLQYASAELSTHDNGEVTKTLQDNIQSALTGAKSVKQALNDAQTLATAELKPYNK
jgi:ABC-type sugar transport system, periplasmic component